MNHIKYINPKTLEVKRIRVRQHEVDFNQMTFRERALIRHRPTVPQADDLMARRGFVRCGLRLGKPAARRLLRAQHG